ncbi:DUF924 family protein [Parasphingorhabdus litoris]|uniref:DUF924 family protein n=1 Tax=Parasphingorhabdus litoris TaxID=394733 RepID=A0ABP3JVI8_9SPHN|nr:DUF924 family protein [Parasphingorhabdus litoris]
MTDIARCIEDVLAFWFTSETEKHWFESTPEFDQEITEKFGELYAHAVSGELEEWRSSRDGRLALTLLFDQLPRMAFRDTPKAYASDGLGRELAHHAIGLGDDIDLAREGERHAFFYLPLMHQENLEDQRRAVELYTTHGPESGLEWARHHYDIIARFGRFPHRNRILGRYCTAQEAAFVQSNI